MAYEQFIEKKFQRKSLKIIAAARAITDDYAVRGFRLTLRQLFYQFVARDLLANQQKNYKRLGSIIDDARQAGLLDWDTIEDRTRNLRRLSSWKNPESAIESIASQYREDVWAEQPYRPEVWIEKDALVGVIVPVCQKFRVPYFACRGYTSQSEAYAAGKRFERYRENDQIPIVFHLGDHDPSGLHMTEDNADRLDLFSWGPVEVRRLALNMDQIRHYNPPPNPAKDTDSRFDKYVERYGRQSWELDALDPDVIEKLIRDAIESITDPEAWRDALKAEQTNRNLLDEAAFRWSDIQDFLS